MVKNSSGLGDSTLVPRTLVATLYPGQIDERILFDTMARCNRAANDVADLAYHLGRARTSELSATLYDVLRRRYGLPANLVLHAITKVVLRFRMDSMRQPYFRDDADLFYQEGKSFRWTNPDCVSILTVEGRRKVPARFERYQEVGQPSFSRGNAGLISIDRQFLLCHVVMVPDVPAPELPDPMILRARLAAT